MYGNMCSATSGRLQSALICTSHMVKLQDPALRKACHLQACTPVPVLEHIW
jgi:hypothetical protein